MTAWGSVFSPSSSWKEITESQSSPGGSRSSTWEEETGAEMIERPMEARTPKEEPDKEDLGHQMSLTSFSKEGGDADE